MVSPADDADLCRWLDSLGLGKLWTVRAEEQNDDVRHLPWAHLRLPPFPQVAVRVLKMAGSDNMQLHQLSELISSDPAFASEVLSVANSVLYAPRYPVHSILQAIAVLGANALQGMCITVGVRAYMGTSMRLPAMRALWHHNLACALVAQRLAAGPIDKDQAYTAGILHDIGRFALAAIQPKDYAELLETHEGAADSILDRERDLFSWDHCETGRRLISDWHLPAEFDSVVLEHHAPRLKDGSWGLSELVKVGCRLADAAGFPAFPGCEVVPYPVLLERLPASQRESFYPDRESLAEEVATGIQAIESV
jgi:HD-like signal output (HDOD) protein